MAAHELRHADRVLNAPHRHEAVNDPVSASDLPPSVKARVQSLLFTGLWFAHLLI
jgi:hypothetical protein